MQYGDNRAKGYGDESTLATSLTYVIFGRKFIHNLNMDIIVNLHLQIDSDGNGFIDVNELGEVLGTCGIKLPGYEIRNLVREFDSKIKDDKLDFAEFQAVSRLFAKVHL